MTKNDLCLSSPLLNYTFMEGRSVADSSVSRPHPVDYFTERWYSVSVVYWRYNWKPVYRMTDGICSMCLGHPRKGSPASPVS